MSYAKLNNIGVDLIIRVSFNVKVPIALMWACLNYIEINLMKQKAYVYNMVNTISINLIIRAEV